jgi:uncharacterized protein YicC (UPF0701 family)
MRTIYKLIAELKQAIEDLRTTKSQEGRNAQAKRARGKAEAIEQEVSLLDNQLEGEWRKRRDKRIRRDRSESDETTE